METLFQKIKIYLDIADESFEIPEYINNNLKHDFWYWQKEAMQFFHVFETKICIITKKATDILFSSSIKTISLIKPKIILSIKIILNTFFAKIL
jgi:hypothetical protein